MKSISSTLLAVALLGSYLCNGTALAEHEQASISVTGHGEFSDAPDIAVIGFAVETTAPEAATAMAENASKSQAVAKALKSAIGKSDTITTSGYSVDPVYDHRRNRPPNEPPTITGYVARNQVRVQTANTNAVGDLIDLAAKAGVNRISGLHFRLDKQDDAKSEALRRATADARRQAATIADSLGVKLGGVLHATTSQPATIAPRAFRGAAMAMEAHAPTPIEPGEVRVDATVHVTYEID